MRKSLACCGGGGERQDVGDVGSGLLEREGDEDAVDRMVARRRHDGGAPRIGFSDEKATFRGSHAKRMQVWLKAKRREIELKTFDLGVKRDELRCLQMVQRRERERQLALEMERKRAQLDDGQVRRISTESRMEACFVLVDGRSKTRATFGSLVAAISRGLHRVNSFNTDQPVSYYPHR